MVRSGISYKFKVQCEYDGGLVIKMARGLTSNGHCVGRRLLSLGTAPIRAVISDFAGSFFFYHGICMNEASVIEILPEIAIYIHDMHDST